MELVELLGLKLKSDEIVEIIEMYNLEANYEFDRLHENTDDIYWISAKNNGFLMRFNKDQILDTIFLYITESEGYKKFDTTKIDIALPLNMDDAKKYFINNNIKHELQDGIKTILGQKWWIKGDFGKYFIHYEYSPKQLQRITLMKKDGI